ncbi:hypothetical protein B0H16DRAFT_1735099 [Mycena metata]|uniref:Uncharacterized protein n=1 Tax=Mycena metata TaxID=1033252 RepID=A0AAD7HU70_9AGAR|nr:hypothetical protein B0H16DRAFT_1735099 [Mycena metata]
MASSAASNLIAVTDAALPVPPLADLTRVSPQLLAAQVNTVVAELAKKHPGILALSADQSLNIEGVPSSWSYAHTLLAIARIAGADALALTQAVITQPPGPSPSPPPQRQTRKQTRRCPRRRTKLPVRHTHMHALMAQSNVGLFMKGDTDEPRCGFSRKISALREQGIRSRV